MTPGAAAESLTPSINDLRKQFCIDSPSSAPLEVVNHLVVNIYGCELKRRCVGGTAYVHRDEPFIVPNCEIIHSKIIKRIVDILELCE